MHTSHMAVPLALIAASALATGVAAGGPVASKQRIAIEVKSSALTGDGTFTLIPLSPGPLRGDSGRVAGSGDIKPSRIRTNGQRVTVVVGTDALQGKRGTLRISQRVLSVDASRSYSADSGTWIVSGGTGAYAALHGGGGLAGVAAPDGTVLYRQEGYVREP